MFPSLSLYQNNFAKFDEKRKVKIFCMGILDFITKAQEKLNDVQKRIETTSLESLFEKPKVAENVAVPKPSKAAKQILAQRDSMKRNGFEEYEYLANSGCCEICGKLNGKHFLVSELKIGVNAPPMHDGCSCSIAAYSDRKEYDDWLNSL